jgi:hypothetical protein
MCSEVISSSCSTSCTHSVNLATKLVTSHEWGQEQEMLTYSRVCGSYQDFLDIGLPIPMKLRNQGFLLEKLKSSLQNCYGRHHDFVNRNGVTHNHGYVPLVVSISCSCPHSWLVTSFVARLTLWVQLVERKSWYEPQTLEYRNNWEIYVPFS